MAGQPCEFREMRRHPASGVSFTAVFANRQRIPQIGGGSTTIRTYGIYLNKAR
jgi:hypothetical protein